MVKQAEKHGNGKHGSGGRNGGQTIADGPRVGGHGWHRPGFITLPGPANDNRLTAGRLLRQPRFWVWAGLMALLAILLATRI